MLTDTTKDKLSTDYLWQEATERYLLENIKKKGLDADRDYLKTLKPFLKDKSLSAITMEDIWPFIRYRIDIDCVANGTVNRALSLLRRILHLSRDEWNWIIRFHKIRMLPEPRCRVRFLTGLEAHQLLNALPYHLEMVTRFALSTGCRMSEILSLEWSRVDISRSIAWLEPGTTKNGEGRGIPLNQDALDVLTMLDLKKSKWCFTYKGKKMSRVGSSWKRTLNKVSINNFRFHDLRHTWASWHVQNGTNLHELMQLGGWRSYEMVLKYAHLSPEHLLTAAARIKLPK